MSSLVEERSSPRFIRGTPIAASRMNSGSMVSSLSTSFSESGSLDVKTESEDSNCSGSDNEETQELDSAPAKSMLKNDFRISRHIDRVQIHMKMTELSMGGPMIVERPDFVLESGDPEVKLNEIRLFFIDQDKHTPYYEYYFHGKDHSNFLGFEKNGDPVFVSLEKKDKKDLELDPNCRVRALIRTCKPPTMAYDDEWVLIPATAKSIKKELAAARPSLFNTLKLINIEHPDLEKELLTLEKQLVFTNFKFGVLNFLEENTDDNSMFRNSSVSPDFTEFLGFLGEKVKLQGWTNFRGGLDVKTNTTGEYSVYTKISNFQIMFHISAYLPFFPNDEQQVERKRHLGNDVVVFIFKETSKPFDPSVIKSEFNHIFIVIQVDRKEGDKTFYKVAIASKDGVHSYEPSLPFPAIFEKNDRFKDFILTKAINSERAAMYAPSFVQAMQRTRKQLLRDLASKYSNMKDAKKKGFFSRLTGN